MFELERDSKHEMFQEPTNGVALARYAVQYCMSWTAFLVVRIIIAFHHYGNALSTPRK
jgi:hypothetical protein